jgi:hypothetical protein
LADSINRLLEKAAYFDTRGLVSGNVIIFDDFDQIDTACTGVHILVQKIGQARWCVADRAVRSEANKKQRGDLRW